MFGNAFSGWHLLILLAVVLLLFGAAKLPRLAQSVGQSMRVFKSEVKTLKEENEAPAPALDDAAPLLPPAVVTSPLLRGEPSRQNRDV